MTLYRRCIECSEEMTERGANRVEGLRVFQAKEMCSRCYQKGVNSGDISVRPKNSYTDTEILCMKCTTWKPNSKFKKSVGTASGYEYVCRFCGKIAERYGISNSQYLQMFENQDGKCGICDCKIELYAKDTHIDHDHACCDTRKVRCGSCVRGLLCFRCNLGLGYFRDNPDYLQGAINYLRNQ